jgi:hypothetical protein
MPPIRSQNAQKRVEQEGRILLAIKAIKNQEITFIREATRRFDVPFGTLYSQLPGQQFRRETPTVRHQNSRQGGSDQLLSIFF